MEMREGEMATLLIARDHVRPLIDRFGMVKNELSSLLDLPEPLAGSDGAALAWWQARSDEEQYTLRAALAALASPLLIADTGINIRNERLIYTHVLLPSLRWNDPAFLVAPEDNGTRLKLEYLQKADLLTNTLLLYLESGAPAYTMEMKFEIPVQDFAVLLAAIDLRERVRYQALLDHAPFPTSYKTSDIAAGFTGGIAYPDPRWLFPFALPALHLNPDTLTPDSVRQSLGRLEKTGLIKSGGDTVAFTEPGEKFAESAGGRISSIRLDLYGVDAAGHNGRQSVVLVRGEHLLWYAGTSGKKADTIIVTSITLDQAGQLLQELFTPSAAPKPVAPAASAAAPAAAPAATPSALIAPAAAAAAPQAPPSPPKAAAPAPEAQPAGGLVCKACGNPIKPGDKFCSKCLVKVPEVPVPEAVQAPVAAPLPKAAPGSGKKFCESCGASLKPGLKFCSSCGAKIK